MNYKFGRKNHARRWVWNRTSERLRASGFGICESVVLYLAGAQDLDRPVALSHGFRSNNLIAIERDPAVCRELRRAGVLAIHGDAAEVVAAFPVSRVPVVALILDTMMPGGNAANRLFEVAMLTVERGGVVAINLQRGRERDDEIRRQCRRTPGMHRGYLTLAHWIADALPADVISEPNDCHCGDERMVCLFKRCQPDLFSYRSSVGMDWMVVYQPLPRDSGTRSPSREIRRQIAAVLAHRTRRAP